MVRIQSPACGSDANGKTEQRSDLLFEGVRLGGGPSLHPAATLGGLRRDPQQLIGYRGSRVEQLGSVPDDLA